MRQRVPISKKRARPRVVHSERTAHIVGHERVRLYGKAREARRAEIFERAGGRCEEIIYCTMPECQPARLYHNWKCTKLATEWSHARHGANQCDCYSPTSVGACSIASCSECHRKRHNSGGKPVPRKTINGGSSSDGNI